MAVVRPTSAIVITPVGHLLFFERRPHMSIMNTLVPWCLGTLGDFEYVSSNRLRLSEIPSLNQTFGM